MDIHILIISIFTFVSVVLLAVVLLNSLRETAEAYRKKYVAETGQQLEEMFLFFTPDQLLVLSILFALLGGFLGYVYRGSWITGLVLAAVGWYLPKVYLTVARRKRIEKFEQQLMDALSTLSNSMRAGFSLIQALEMCAKEMNPPLSQEFGLMLREHRLGVTLDMALQNLGHRIPSKNLDLVVTSILIARSTGGNLTEVFTSIADTMRTIMTIEGKIRSLTAQGKLQGMVIGCLPVVMAWVMYQLDPSMMNILFTDPIGWGILGLIVFLEVIGAYFIWRIVSIDI